jgi:hypothetical protein
MGRSRESRSGHRQFEIERTPSNLYTVSERPIRSPNYLINDVMTLWQMTSVSAEPLEGESRQQGCSAGVKQRPFFDDSIAALAENIGIRQLNGCRNMVWLGGLS